MFFLNEWNDIKDKYPNIKISTRLVYGDRDWAKPAERDRTAQLIHAVGLKTVKNGGHFLVLDQPEIVASLIEEF